LGGVVLLIYMMHTLLLTAFLMAIGSASETSGYTSFYMYILPMLGFFIGAKLNRDGIARAFFNVALVHAVLGLLFYDFFALPGQLSTIVAKMKDGVFQFRMASVSGSIVFGAIMVYGLISSAYLYEKQRNKFYMIMMIVFLLCSILSQQRSAWGCSILFCLWYFSNNIKERWPYLLLMVVILVSGVNYVAYVSPELLDFLILRFTGSFGGDSNDVTIVNERSHMWLTAIDHFILNPFGLGAGQGGWISYTQDVNIDIVVTDGDYFRLLLESGIPGVLVFIYLLGAILLSFIRDNRSEASYMYWLTIGSALQMVGSNITELYYANFAFWLALGVNHQLKRHMTVRRQSKFKVSALTCQTQRV
jgi:hypothetical protein